MQGLRGWQDFIKSTENVGLNGVQLLVLALTAGTGWLIGQGVLSLFGSPFDWLTLIGIVVGVLASGFFGRLIVREGPERYAVQVLLVLFAAGFASSGGSHAVVMILGRALH